MNLMNIDSVLNGKLVFPLFVILLFSMASCNKDEGIDHTIQHEHQSEHEEMYYSLEDYNYIYRENNLVAPQALLDDIAELLIESNQKWIEPNDNGILNWSLSSLDYTNDHQYTITVPLIEQSSLTGLLAFINHGGHYHFDFISIDDLNVATDSFGGTIGEGSLKFFSLKYHLYASLLGIDISKNLNEFANNYENLVDVDGLSVESRFSWFTILVYLYSGYEEDSAGNQIGEPYHVFEHQVVYVPCPPEITAPDPGSGGGSGGGVGGEGNPPIQLDCENTDMGTVSTAGGIVDPCTGEQIGLDYLNELCVNFEGPLSVEDLYGYLDQEGVQYVDFINNTINGQTPEDFGYPPGTNLSDIPLEELCESSECVSLNSTNELFQEYTYVKENGLGYHDLGVYIDIFVDKTCCTHSDGSIELLSCDKSTSVTLLPVVTELPIPLYGIIDQTEISINRGTVTVTGTYAVAIGLLNSVQFELDFSFDLDPGSCDCE